MSVEIEPSVPLIPLWWVAKALGWTTELARDRFIRANLAMKPPGATEWSVMRSSLLAVMPLIVARIDEMCASGELRKVRANRLSEVAKQMKSANKKARRSSGTESARHTR